MNNNLFYKSILSFMAMFMIIISLTCCSKDDNNSRERNSSSNLNMGKDNTTDMAVTGGVQDVGMTYAKVLGYVNISADYRSSAIANNLNFRVSVLYGESENNLTNSEIGTLDDRTMSVTLRGLKAGKTYYYKTYVEWGRHGIYDNDYWEDYDVIGVAKEMGSFTTKNADFNGTMSVETATDITFFKATISANIDVSRLHKDETYTKGIVYSIKESDLSGVLATKLSEAYRERADYYIITYPNSYYGNYVNESLHFAINDDDKVTINMEPSSTVYYCPFVIISDKSFIGEKKQVKLRDLPIQSGFVDLGLSCKWAATNLDADTPWDMGGYYKQNNALSKIRSQYGSDAHFPSQEEVEELNKCTIEEIDNGVLITGLNGNQLFIPSVSRSDESSSQVSLSINSYMTSSVKGETWGSGKYSHQLQYNILFGYNSSSQAFTTRTSTIPFYDSSTYGSNKYNYQYCYSRAVKDGGSGGGNDDNGGNVGDNDDDGGNTTYTFCPDNNHPHAINLSLPSGTKWACCNVGANSPEQVGGLYAWGETETKETYTWDTYLYGSGEDDIMSLGRDIAGTSYDVAHVKWGGSWQMPTVTRMSELIKNTTHSFTTFNGVRGCILTGGNGTSIFLPILPYSNFGWFWGSNVTSASIRSYLAPIIVFDVDKETIYTSNANRYDGLYIRPIQ